MGGDRVEWVLVKIVLGTDIITNLTIYNEWGSSVGNSSLG